MKYKVGDIVIFTSKEGHVSKYGDLIRIDSVFNDKEYEYSNISRFLQTRCSVKLFEEWSIPASELTKVLYE